MKTRWESTELALLQKYYPHVPTTAMAAMLQCTVKRCHAKAKFEGIRKSREFLRSPASGRRVKGVSFRNAGSFKKGHNPWNAGNTGISVSPGTQFKKGNVPANTLHDGAITIRLDTNQRTARKIAYRHIRVSKGRWQYYHRYLWEQAHGPIPKGIPLVFKNGNTLDCRLENLELISRKELLKRNRNREKAAQSLRETWAEGNHGVHTLSDSYVAGMLAYGNQDIKQEILDYYPWLIEAKRASLLLNRIIKKQKNGKNAAT